MKTPRSIRWTASAFIWSAIWARRFGSPDSRAAAAMRRAIWSNSQDAKFLCETTQTKVDFCSPGRSALMRLVDPKEFIERGACGGSVTTFRATMRGGWERFWHNFPPAQIRDAFRAAGYSPEEVEGFASAGAQDRRVDRTVRKSRTKSGESPWNTNTRSARRAGEAAIAQTARERATAANAPFVTALESVRNARDAVRSLAPDPALARSRPHSGALRSGSMAANHSRRLPS